ncbi:MAG: aldo/keto reductase [Planctomycetota bacterium]|jgi:aryl-alcohol dehydrogenase-like predicted oxidoreductase
MQYRPLGRSEIKASVVTFGAWAVGGWMWGGQEESDAIAAIHAAIDAGVNTIDTAPMYGFGRSEEIVGKAVADRRDGVVIATKCGMRWDHQKGKLFFTSSEEAIDAEGDHDVYVYNGPESIRVEVERSLRRLGTDYIDLLQTHWQDPTTPLEETIGVLDELVTEGKIRAFGPCNATPEQLAAYAGGGASTDQEKFSMIDRGLESTNIAYCLDEGLAVLAYSPMANGLLTGRMSPDREFAPTDLRSQRPRFSVQNRKRVAVFLDALMPLAEGHDATLAQLVVAWTIQQPGVTHALVGARTPEQAVENAEAASIRLGQGELDKIDDALEKLGELDASVPRATRK